MNFGEQIKQLRKGRKLTQQEMADKLGISRQAISNWENDKNLPDIEMLITMSQVFGITLDELILEGNHMNNMTEKLIKDGSENARIKMNLLGIKIGGALMALAFASLIVGIWAPLNLEGYFGDAFTYMALAGLLTFVIVGFKNIIDTFRANVDHGHSLKLMAFGGIFVNLGAIGYVLSFTVGMVDSYVEFALIGIGIVLMVIGAVKSRG